MSKLGTTHLISEDMLIKGPFIYNMIILFKNPYLHLHKNLLLLPENEKERRVLRFLCKAQLDCKEYSSIYINFFVVFVGWPSMSNMALHPKLGTTHLISEEMMVWYHTMMTSAKS